MREDELFDWAVREIQDAYTALGYTLGWRFLFTPRATLRRNADFFVVGLNPAGSEYIAPTAHSERGNAFRPGVGLQIASSTYADRLCEMFRVIAGELGVPWQELMDRTPTSNFCPFRAPDGLPQERTAEARAFSRRLWGGLLAELRPRAVLTLGGEATREFGKLLGAAGGTALIEMPHPSSRISNRDRLKAVQEGTGRLRDHLAGPRHP